MTGRFRYEPPLLFDMNTGSALGYSGTCDGGSCNFECSLGSCIPTSFCQDGQYTGGCENGIGACSTSSNCYTCCADGQMVGFYGSGRGTVSGCQCISGANAAYICYTGGRVSAVCIDGSMALEDCNGACA